jgi:WD40 repeat protein
MKIHWFYISLLIITISVTGLISAKEPAKTVVSWGHSDSVYAVALSPNGKYLASGSWNGTVILWDIQSGRVIRTFSQFPNRIQTLTFSNDSKLLFSGSTIIKIWDISNGQEIKTIGNDLKLITHVGISPDQKYALLAEQGGTINLVDISSGKTLQIFPGDNSDILSFGFSADGEYVATGNSKRINIWDIKQTKLVHIYIGHTKDITCIAFSPDGKYILSGGSDKTVILWDILSGKILRKWTNFSGELRCISFSPDGKSFLTGTWDKEIQLWSIEKGSKIKSYIGHTNGIAALTFFEDGKNFVSGSSDNTIRIWDITSGKTIKTLPGHQNQVRAVAFSHDGHYIITTGMDHLIRIWDKENGQLIQSFDAHSERVDSIALSSDNQYIISGSWDKSARLWLLKNGKMMKKFPHEMTVSSVDFLNERQQIVTGSGGTVRIWDIKSGHLVKTLAGYADGVLALSCSPDERFLVSGHYNGSLILWDLTSGKAICSMLESDGKPICTSFATVVDGKLIPFNMPKYSIQSVVFSNDGKYICAGSSDGMVRIWDITNGQLIKKFVGDPEWVEVVAFSRNNQQVIVGGHRGLKIFDINTGQILKVLLEQTEPVDALAVSTDGENFISGSWDGSVKLWDYKTSRELASFYGFPDNEWMVITPEGYYNGSPNAKKYLYFDDNGNLTPINDDYERKYFCPNLKIIPLPKGT